MLLYFQFKGFILYQVNPLVSLLLIDILQTTSIKVTKTTTHNLTLTFHKYTHVINNPIMINEFIWSACYKKHHYLNAVSLLSDREGWEVFSIIYELLTS